MRSTRFLALVLPLAFVACEKTKPARIAPARPKTGAKPSSTEEINIGEGIVLSFPHTIILDVTNGSKGRRTRKILLQTVNTPVNDAVEQLSRTLRLAKFTKLGDDEIPGSKLTAWSKDGKKLDTTAFGILITVSNSPEENYRPDGSLTLEIDSKTD